MGRLVEQVLKESDHEIIARVDPEVEGCSTLEDELWIEADAGICFVDPVAVMEVSETVLNAGIDLVIGTTKFYMNGNTLNDEVIDRLDFAAVCSASRGVYAPNFDPTVHAYWKKIADAAPRMAQEGYFPIIFESHHTGKKDVSGTAIKIGDILLKHFPHLDGLSFDFNKAIWPNDYSDYLMLFDPVFKGEEYDVVRNQVRHAKENNQIPIVAFRAGDIPGTHRVQFYNAYTSGFIDHVAGKRINFAYGAVDALAWLQKKTTRIIFSRRFNGGIKWQ